MSLLQEAWDSGICPRCNAPKRDIDEQFSFGVYAGVMCTECAIHGYRDACGHRPEGQGDPADLDEPYWEEDY
jgi:hypothetical protein